VQPNFRAGDTPSTRIRRSRPRSPIICSTSCRQHAIKLRNLGSLELARNLFELASLRLRLAVPAPRARRGGGRVRRGDCSSGQTACRMGLSGGRWKATSVGAPSLLTQWLSLKKSFSQHQSLPSICVTLGHIRLFWSTTQIARTRHFVGSDSHSNGVREHGSQTIPRSAAHAFAARHA
jgi:hypothetical protein